MERNVAARSTLLIPSKPRSFSDLVMKLLLPRGRHERSLVPSDRARAREVLMRKLVEPRLVELESAPVRGGEISRKLLLIDQLTEYVRLMTEATNHGDGKASEAAAKQKRQLIAEIVMLLKEVDPPPSKRPPARGRLSSLLLD